MLKMFPQVRALGETSSRDLVNEAEPVILKVERINPYQEATAGDARRAPRQLYHL
jgi:hypothetical protein